MLLISATRNGGRQRHLEVHVTSSGNERKLHPSSLQLRETEEKNQALVGATPFCGEYRGPRLEDKFRSANQMDGIKKADGDKMAAS